MCSSVWKHAADWSEASVWRLSRVTWTDLTSVPLHSQSIQIPQIHLLTASEVHQQGWMVTWTTVLKMTSLSSLRHPSDGASGWWPPPPPHPLLPQSQRGARRADAALLERRAGREAWLQHHQDPAQETAQVVPLYAINTLIDKFIN